MRHRSCSLWLWIRCTLLCGTPHGLGFDRAKCSKLTRAKDTLLKILVQVRCADGGNGAPPYLAHFVKRSDIGQGSSKEWCKGAETCAHVLHLVESFFLTLLCAVTFVISLFTGTMPFPGYITGWRREGAMITQRAVTVRLRKEGIQHLTDFLRT